MIDVDRLSIYQLLPLSVTLQRVLIAICGMSTILVGPRAASRVRHRRLYYAERKWATSAPTV